MDVNIAKEILQELRRHGWTLGFAESCTGGLLSAELTLNAGVSDVYRGAVVAYANEVKVSILGVANSSLQSFGAVSEPVAKEMAKGARRALHADCAVAVTGIAGPTGGTPDKPVGLVCLAASGPNFEVSKSQIFSGDRREIQQQSLLCGWRLLLEQLRLQ